MMPNSRPATRQEIAHAVQQRKEELAAVERVHAVKKKSLELLTQADSLIADGNLSGALSCFIEVQRSEFELVLAGFDERINALRAFIAQADSPIIPGHVGRA